MKYNIRRKSDLAMELTEDRNRKSKRYNKWMSEFISIVDEKDMPTLKIFVKNNIPINGFLYFLMSMISYTRSVYSDNVFNEVLEIIRSANPNLEVKISDYSQ